METNNKDIIESFLDETFQRAYKEYSEYFKPFSIGFSPPTGIINSNYYSMGEQNLLPPASPMASNQGTMVARQGVQKREFLVGPDGIARVLEIKGNN